MSIKYASSSVYPSLSLSVHSYINTDVNKVITTTYQISIKYLNKIYEISRRFNEFDILYNNLCKFNNNVPALPIKTWFKSYEPEFLKQRCSELDVFLKNIINSRLFLSNPIVHKFLELPKHLTDIEYANFLNIPSERIILKDPKFGVNNLIYDHVNGILFTVCEDASIFSRVDTYISNVRMPWEEKTASLPIGALNVWLRDSVNDWSCVHSLYYDCQASSVCWDNSKKIVYIGCETGAVLIYSLDIIDDKNIKLSTLSEHKYHFDRITGLYLDKPNNRLISCSRDKNVISFDVCTNKVLSVTPCGEAWLSCQFYDEPTKRLFLGTYGNNILIYDTHVSPGDNFKLIANLEGQKGSVRSIHYDNPSRYLFAGCFDWTVCMWDIGVVGKEATRSRIVAQLKTGPQCKVKSVMYCPTSRYVIAGYENGHIGIYESRTAELIHVIEAHTRDVTHFQWLDSFRILISSSLDCDVKFWLFPEEISTFPNENSAPTLIGSIHNASNEDIDNTIVNLTNVDIDQTINKVSKTTSLAPVISTTSTGPKSNTKNDRPKTPEKQKPMFFQSGQFAPTKLQPAPDFKVPIVEDKPRPDQNIASNSTKNNATTSISAPKTVYQAPTKVTVDDSISSDNL